MPDQGLILDERVPSARSIGRGAVPNTLRVARAPVGPSGGASSMPPRRSGAT
jgi:hypothetical protein